jgi:ComF family protein
MRKNLLALLWPDPCPLCGSTAPRRDAHPLCNTCLATMAPYTGARCSVCGRPLPAETAIRCGDCTRRPPPFDTVVYYGLYDDPLRAAIRLFKYHGRRSLAPFLARLLADTVPADTAELCPVPLHPRRLRKRGYNQSLLLAHHLGRRTGVHVNPDRLIRSRDTRPQVGLSRTARLGNIRGAIDVSTDAGIRNRTVVVVDDVCTTAATAAVCAGALRRAGAGRVIFAALARDDPGSA